MSYLGVMQWLFQLSPGACPACLKVNVREYQDVVLNKFKVGSEDRAMSVDFVNFEVNHGIDQLLLFLILNMYWLVRELLFLEARRYCIHWEDLKLVTNIHLLLDVLLNRIWWSETTNKIYFAWKCRRFSSTVL